MRLKTKQIERAVALHELRSSLERAHDYALTCQYEGATIPYSQLPQLVRTLEVWKYNAQTGYERTTENFSEADITELENRLSSI